jgi:hypothetical protein
MLGTGPTNLRVPLLHGMSHVSYYYVMLSHLILTCLASEGSRPLLPPLILRWLRVTLGPADVAPMAPYYISHSSIYSVFKPVVVVIDRAMDQATSPLANHRLVYSTSTNAPYGTWLVD